MNTFWFSPIFLCGLFIKPWMYMVHVSISNAWMLAYQNTDGVLKVANIYWWLGTLVNGHCVVLYPSSVKWWVKVTCTVVLPREHELIRRYRQRYMFAILLRLISMYHSGDAKSWPKKACMIYYPFCYIFIIHFVIYLI